MNKLKIVWKKILYYLQLLDGIWSAPLVFCAFVLLSVLFQFLFGYTTGLYDPAPFLALFLAISIVIGATTASVLALYFNFRALFYYLYGKKKKNMDTGEQYYFNLSKRDWKALQSWQRFLVAFFVFFFFMGAIIGLFLKLV